MFSHSGVLSDHKEGEGKQEAGMPLIFVRLGARVQWRPSVYSQCSDIIKYSSKGDQVSGISDGLVACRSNDNTFLTHFHFFFNQ